MIVVAAGFVALLGLAVAAGAGLTALCHVRGELCGYIQHIDGACKRLEGPWA